MHKSKNELLDMAKINNNKTFQEIFSNYVSEQEDISPISLSIKKNKKNKGWCGNVFQECVFNIPANSDSSADFKDKYDEDLELKVTPVKRLNNGTFSPKERLVLGMINYNNMSSNFNSSHVLEKSKNILITLYEYKKEVKPENYRVLQSLIWDYDAISVKDREQIEKDYDTIKAKVDDGIAEQISGKDTVILEALRKGQGKGKDLVTQPYSKTKAKSRAFALKQSYLKKLFNDALQGVKTNFVDFLNEESKRIVAYLQSLKGKDLISLSGVKSKAKNKNSNAIKKILESWNPDVYEYCKQGQIKIRTMKLKPNGLVQESFLVSTSVIDQKKIIKEENFKESLFYEDLNKPYVIVTINEKNDESYIDDVNFLESFLKNDEMYKNAELVWKQAKEFFEIINKNPEFWNLNLDKLFKLKDKKQFHVRPHAKDGSIKYENTGLTKQAFWVNNATMTELLKDK